MYFCCYVYVFLLLWMSCSVYSVFIVPTGTLRLPWLRVSTQSQLPNISYHIILYHIIYRCLQPRDGQLFLFSGWWLALSTCWDPSLRIMCLHELYINRYDTKSNTCMYMHASILHTVYTSHMFRPLTWPSSGRCITKDTSKYYKVFEPMHRYKILKLHGLEYILRIKIHRKIFVIESNG
jgi:hypothetical protein